jgi:hypothetical protein
MRHSSFTPLFLRLSCLILLISFTLSPQAQQPAPHWLNPLDAGYPVIDGRGWQEGMANPYDRLPGYAEKQVRGAVWFHSRSAAGLFITFRTDAARIQVRYGVKGEKAMPHMPATGVSGLDLYARDANGHWTWARAGYRFGDTIEYTWTGLATAGKETEFRLYLPLYNAVTWLQFAAESKAFQFLPVSREKPIVAYGTSIMQGGCASRPGLAWTSILGRMQSDNIINLGFSGNGQLEKPLIDAMAKIDAKLYILDCMPNLVDRSKFPPEEVERRTRMAIQVLREAHPGVPILLAEHCCGLSGSNLDTGLVKRYDDCSRVVSDIHARMLKEGVKGLYLLSAKEIGFDQECTVDGTHPNDIGMMRYAEAYARKIRKIL